MEKRPLKEIVSLMCMHHPESIIEYIRRQQPTVWPTLRARCEVLERVVYAHLTADIDVFLNAKWPDPLPSFEPDALRFALEHESVERDPSVFADLSLDRLFALYSFAGRMRSACDDFCSGRARNTLLPSSGEIQGSLFAAE